MADLNESLSPEQVCYSLLVDVEALRAESRLAEAEQLLLKGETLSREKGLDLIRAQLVGTRALVKHQQGDLTLALQLHREEERLFRHLQDARGLAVSLSNQATIFRETQNLSFASSLLREVEILNQELGDSYLLLACLGNQGQIQMDLGNLETAESTFVRVLDLCEELGDTKGYSTTLLNQANLLRLQQRHEEAEEMCVRLQQAFLEIRWLPGYVQALLIRAALPPGEQEHKRGLIEEAIQLCEKYELGDLERRAREDMDTLEHRRSLAPPSARAISASERAKQLYDELQTTAEAWLGPSPAFDPLAASQVEEFRKRIAETLAEVTLDGEGTYACPSPWHAAIQLLTLQSRRLAGSESDRQSMTFRGQSDYRWPITASIQRQGVDVASERKALASFSVVLKRLFERAGSHHEDFVPLDDAPALYTAAAQHYGIKTELLDFTIDPCVAVAFANASPGGGIASVFGLPFHQARSSGLRILLPHPYFQRLFLQRGVFLDTTQGFAPDTFQALCTEVRFQPMAGFDLYRNRVPLHLLPPEPFFESIVQQVRAREQVRSADEAAADAILERAGGLPRPEEPDSRRQLVSDAMLELWHTIYSLSVLSSQEGSPVFDGGALWEFVKDNRQAMQLAGQIFRGAMRALAADGTEYRFNLPHQSLADAVALLAEVRLLDRPPVDLGARWQLVRDVSDSDLAGLVVEFHQKGARVEISRDGPVGWLVYATR